MWENKPLVLSVRDNCYGTVLYVGVLSGENRENRRNDQHYLDFRYYPHE